MQVPNPTAFPKSCFKSRNYKFLRIIRQNDQSRNANDNFLSFNARNFEQDLWKSKQGANITAGATNLIMKKHFDMVAI